ncbi:MAG TPA: PA domain-containing protein, partial [Micromonospora sp.]
TYGAESGVRVDTDRTITFDARKASPVTFETPKPSEALRTQIGLTLFDNAYTIRDGFQDGANLGTKLYAIPSQLGGKLEHRLGWSTAAPALAAKIVGPGAVPITPEYVGGWVGSARLDGTRLLRPVAVGTGRPQDYAGTSVRGQLALVRRSADVSVRQQITNAAAAGAAAVMIYNNDPATWGANIYQKTPTEIPAMTLPGAQGATLAELARRGEVMVQFDATAVSPYTYEVVRYQDGIAADQHYRIKPEELATVDTSFYASTPGTEGGYSRLVTSPAQSFSVSIFIRTTMPRAVTEYVTAGRPTWEVMAPAGVWESMPGFQVTLPSVLQPDERASRAWNKAIVRTAIPAGMPDGAVRLGEVGVVYNSGLLDEATGQWMTYRAAIDKELTAVYRDGQLLGTAKGVAVAFPMSPQRAEYRVVSDVSRDAPYWTTSTRVNTAWTFHSAPSDAAKAPLPVLSVVYDLGVDLDNRVPARSSAELGLSFRYPKELAAPRITSVKLWASYDDGATWRPVTVTTAGAAGATGVLKSPALDDTNGFVALRVQATDADGNTVEQTVTRAYQLRG